MLQPINNPMPGSGQRVDWTSVFTQTAQGIAQRLTQGKAPRSAVAPAAAPVQPAAQLTIDPTMLLIGGVVLFMLLQKGGRR